MTDRPLGEWQVETTEQFDEDFSALLAAGGQRLEEFRESGCFYLHRNPVTMTTGLSGPEDDNCRVTVYADPQVGVEYFLGVAVDRQRRIVWVKWLDSCEFEPDFNGS